MIVIFDGPEKAGKSTLIAEVADILRNNGDTVSVRKWGPVDPDDRVYAEAIKYHSAHAQHTIELWDRSWASEHVYALILGRTRRLKNFPWLGEHLYGRATHRHFMVTAPIGHLREHRDETDLDVDPGQERIAFLRYANKFNWKIVDPVGNGLEVSASEVFHSIARKRRFRTTTLFVSSLKYLDSAIPGGFLPFSSAAEINKLNLAEVKDPKEFDWEFVENLDQIKFRLYTTIFCIHEGVLEVVNDYLDWRNIDTVGTYLLNRTFENYKEEN